MKTSRVSGRIVAGGVFLFAALGPVLQVMLGAHPAVLALRWAGVLAVFVLAMMRRNLTLWILLGMIAGAELGFDEPHAAVGLRLLSDIFLRLIKAIVAPLILSTLVVGIAGHGDLKGLARIALKALVYFEVVTTLALVIGLSAINLSHAGVGLSMPVSASAAQTSAAPQHWQDIVLHMFPENIAKSIADDQVLQVAVFAFIFGVALALLPETRRKPLLDLAKSMSETMFRFTGIVMYFAPLGVFGAMAYTVSSMGVGVFVNLGKLVLTLYAALAVFGVCVMLPAAMLFRIPVRRFLRAITVPATIAFATGSSEAALPRAMEALERFGVPERIVGFVLPLGYSFNLDGSTLYLAICSIFIAQAAGIHLALPQQLMLMFTLMLTSKGVAGVPRSMFVVLLATVSTFHLPTEPIFIILGIDALMDMGRATVNVAGNCLASAVVARSEGVLHVPSERALEDAEA